MSNPKAEKRVTTGNDKNTYHAGDGLLSAYDYGAILFHWLIALLIIIQLIMGYAMQRIESIAEPIRFAMMQWHKTFGILVLILTLARIFWRFVNPPPDHAPMAAIELITAKIVSFLFYALMLLAPLTGWWLVSVSPLEIPTFFFTIAYLEWPHLPLAADEQAAHLAALSHMILSYGFLLLLFLHIGGALKHMIIDHVPEMRRILPYNKMPRKASTPASRRFAWSLVLGLTIIGLGIGQISQLLTPQQTSPLANNTIKAPKVGDWLIDYTQSSLQFRVEFSGEMKHGLIPNWHAEIEFDPEQLEKSHVEVVIDSASITYDDAFVAGSILGEDGLDITNHPQIRVILTQFTRQEANYQANARLDIKDISLPVVVNFTYEETQSQAKVSGQAQIDRLQFAIGTKTDATARYLGKDIYIDFSLQASRQ